MRADIIKILRSWKQRDSTINSTESLLEWVGEMNQKFVVNVNETTFQPDDYWYFDEEKGIIENKSHSFFSIRGLQYKKKNQIVVEQPIIYQPEIGFLGIICKEFDGVMYFLMQAKVEPGNVNCVQISPTIQATKSNFERAHGGHLPNYYYYFENSPKYTIIFDQVQSEQGTRFYKKRNRNIMIRVDEEIEVFANFRWMTLGQVKELMKIDNLVNMDTRTVLSCIPLSTYHYGSEELERISDFITDESLFNSIFHANIQDGIENIYNYLNSIKMFSNVKSKLIPLNQLDTWSINNYGITCQGEANFEVRYYDIEISGREVRQWRQPLVKAVGVGTFGLLLCEHEGMLKFLVAVRPEMGAFDTYEIGPTIFFETVRKEQKDTIMDIFEDRLCKREGIICDSLFSEEGGRFYQEQNRNVILKIDYIEPCRLPRGYFWMTYSSLNSLVQINNCLNIQLRNLLSIIDIA